MDQAQVDWCKYSIPDQWRGAEGFDGNRNSRSPNNRKQGSSTIPQFGPPSDFCLEIVLS